MMKVDKIIPCICCEHQPTEADSVYYGMPILKVTGGTLPNGKVVNFFEAQCPRCGRGGLLQHKSAYLVLRKWNEMQERLRGKTDRAPEGEREQECLHEGIDKEGLLENAKAGEC